MTRRARVVLVVAVSLALGAAACSSEAPPIEAASSADLAEAAPAAEPIAPAAAEPTSAPTTTSTPTVTPVPSATPPPTPTPLPPVCDYTNPNDPFDDPNPGFDGEQGRFPVSENPVPPGFPTPQTTGICGQRITPEELTPSEGLTITDDGTVIDGLDIVGSVVVRANNVTIRNSRITSGSLYVVEQARKDDTPYTGLVIEDTRIRAVGGDVSSAVLSWGFATVRRVHISGGGDALKVADGALVEHSYFAGLYRQPGSHNDIVQIRAGSDYTFRHNTMIGPWRMSTSVFIVQAKVADIAGVLIEDNYLSGGGYTVYTRQDEPYELTDAVVRNNRFESESWQHGMASDSANAVYDNNTELPSTIE